VLAQKGEPLHADIRLLMLRCNIIAHFIKDEPKPFADFWLQIQKPAPREHKNSQSKLKPQVKRTGPRVPNIRIILNTSRVITFYEVANQIMPYTRNYPPQYYIPICSPLRIQIQIQIPPPFRDGASTRSQGKACPLKHHLFPVGDSRLFLPFDRGLSRSRAKAVFRSRLRFRSRTRSVSRFSLQQDNLPSLLKQKTHASI